MGSEGQLATTYQYRPGPNTDVTQLLQVSFGSTDDFPGGTESYGYGAFGRSETKTQVISGFAAYEQTVGYTYDSLNRVQELTYPKQYGLPQDPRKVIHDDFDAASRLSGLKVDSIDYASAPVYNNASQLTSLNVGPSGPLQMAESYAYDPLNGLLKNQTVKRGATPFLDLSYDYSKPGAVGTTGQLMRMTNNLNPPLNRGYSYDALGRLAAATGGEFAAPTWTQLYGYDRYGNRTSVTATGSTPPDGVGSVTFESSTNRLFSTTDPSGAKARYQYDAAGRLAIVSNDAGVRLETYGYGAGRQRLMSKDYVSGVKKYYVWNAGAVVADYTEETLPSTRLQWRKSYVYLGSRILATLTLDGTGTASTVEFHHSDRLGTRLISHLETADVQEKISLPFGTSATCQAGDARCFTSYERSAAAGLDYVVNRQYAFTHGRFTQVDPIGMGASDQSNPRSLNLYAYANDDPVNALDPAGLIHESILHLDGGFGGYGGFSGFDDPLFSAEKPRKQGEEDMIVTGVRRPPLLSAIDVRVGEYSNGPSERGGGEASSDKQYFDKLPKKCQQALANFRDALNRAARETPRYNVDQFAHIGASFFWGDRYSGYTIGQAFDLTGADAPRSCLHDSKRINSIGFLFVFTGFRPAPRSASTTRSRCR